ncbi:MAG: alginate export family protein [Pseudomonadota bacterium]
MSKPLKDRSTVPKLTSLGEQFDLSDGEAASDILDAVVSGRVTTRSKLRFWFANDTNTQASQAFTLGIRAGYLTQEYGGFQAFAEVNHVEALTPNNYFDGVNNNVDRTFVGDVEQTELNQAWIQFNTSTPYLELNARIGRQASAAVDERFIGSTGSRQGEQTFDAAVLAASFGPQKRVSLEYSYIDKVQRIFDADALDYESDSHAVRAAYISDEIGVFSAFAVLLDLEQSSPELSNQTYGVSLDKRGANPNALDLVYSIGFAYQKDFGSNPQDYEATSLYAEAGVSVPDLAIVSLGFEQSSSDAGEEAFQYSLTTGQRLHRLSDTFLTTPDDGLRDYFLNVELPNLPWRTFGELNYHYYRTEENGRELGQEAGLSLTKPLTPNLAVSFLASYFESEDPAFPSLELFNLEFNLQF